MRRGKSLREREMVGVSVRNEDDTHCPPPEPPVEGFEMSVIVGPRIDHRHHRARVDDPGVGARPRVRPRVRGDDASGPGLQGGRYAGGSMSMPSGVLAW